MNKWKREFIEGNGVDDYCWIAPDGKIHHKLPEYVVVALFEEWDALRNCPALASILQERRHQNEKWGEQNHTLGNWGLILMEEVGEWSEAALHTQFGGPKAKGLREEAVQVAAVALQIVQWMDRQAAIDAPWTAAGELLRGGAR